MLVRRSDVAFALVLVWAFVGIAVAQADRSELIVIVAGTAAVLLAAAAAITWRRTRARA
jgi:hypothetical protein